MKVCLGHIEGVKLRFCTSALYVLFEPKNIYLNKRKKNSYKCTPIIYRVH